MGPVAFMRGSRARIMHIVCIVGFITSLAFAFIGKDVPAYSFSMLAIAIIFIISFITNYLGKTSLTEYIVTITTTIWIIYMCVAFGSGLGIQNYIIIALVAWSIFSPKTMITITLILLAASLSLYQYYVPPIFPLPKAAGFIYAMNVITPLTMIAVVCRNFLKDTIKSRTTIEQQKEELEESNKFKDRVFSIIGHDMRSPFNSAKGLVELLDSNILTEEERKTVLQELKTGIDVSLQTLDNILGWASQSYYGAVMHNKTKTEILDMHTLAEKNILLYNHPAAQKNVTFVNKIATGTTVAADAEQIAFVLRNLTSNALKFSHSGQKITYTATDTGEQVIISVKDEGVGMTPEMLTSLFHINTRFSKEGTTKEKGSGLGLIFCKEFIENNIGKLWIESEPGKGTAVFFSLPKKTTIV